MLGDRRRPGLIMKLHGYYRSSASYRIRIILNFKNLPHEHIAVMLNRGAQHEDAFRSINPMGLIPVLETDDALLAQSPAIAEFIEEQHPQPPLLPAGHIERAHVREMMHTVGCDIHPLQNLRVLNYLRSEFEQDDAGIERWCQKWMGDGFAAFEQLAKTRSANGQYAFGDQVSLADVWLIPQVYNARRFNLDLTPFPTIVSIDEHCQALAEFSRAHPSKQEDAPPT
ncbi:MAG: maleylacetoacetate isomerase [Gammaproteobacteria bacterium]|nr:maleylacetoacetate isomerase [Gammaproteobacteria bacterium]